MSRNPINNQMPTNLKDTLLQLEGTLNEWENIAPEDQEAVQLTKEKEVLENELQKKARVILDKLKDQIEELSE